MTGKRMRRVGAVIIFICLSLLYAVNALAAIPVIAQQPQSVAVPDGETATVTVDIQGEGMQYEWWYAPADTQVFIKDENQTTHQYQVQMTMAYHGYKVYCIVSDQYDHAVQTRTVTLYRLPPVLITMQPEDAYACAGESFSVAIEAEGEGLTYTWWFANAGSEEFAQGTADGPVYELEMNERRAGRRIYCVVTDRYGRMQQSETVTVYMTESQSPQTD